MIDTSHQKKEKLTFASKFKSKFTELLIEASNIEAQVESYRSLIINLLSILRDCEDKKAHRSYTLTIRDLKDHFSSEYEFLKNWSE